MESRRARWILLAAFSFSLLFHAIVALIVRRSLPPPSGNREVVSIQHARIVTLEHRPPSPPPPVPPPIPKPQVAPTTSRTEPHSPPANHGTQRKPRVASLAPVPTPQPTAFARPAPCRTADLPAALIVAPSPAPIPADVRAQATDGIARILVRLDSQGAVLGSTVVQSSGNRSLDAVAQTLAQTGRYTPAFKSCKAIASSYTFSVKFAAW